MNLVCKFAVLLTVGACMAGCGGGPSGDASSGSGGTSTPPPPPPSDTAAAKKWSLLATAAVAYNGTFVATNSAARADGSVLYVFGGSSKDDLANGCQLTTFKAFTVTAAGTVADTTALLQQTSSVTHPRQLVVADFNGDGQDDLFFANHGCNLPPYPGEVNSLFLSSGNNFIDRKAALPNLVSFTGSVATGDLRKNGKSDVLVGVLGMQLNANLNAQFKGPNTQGDLVGPYLLRNDGLGNFTYDNTSLPDKIANNLQLSSTTTRFTSSRFADLNGDGFPDLILGSDQNSDVAGSVYLNDGTGKFKTAEIALPAGLFGKGNTITVAITVADVDGDGRPDLLLSQTQNTPVFYGAGKVQVILNKGNGAFVDATAQMIPALKTNSYWAQGVHYTDLNSDGKPDILLESDELQATDSVAYLNQGNGSFAPMDRALLPANVSSLRPLAFKNRTVLVSGSKGPGKAVVNLFELK